MKPFIIKILGFGIVWFLAAELFFRWVVPACDPPRVIQDPEYGILLCDRDAKQSGIFSAGRMAEIRCKWAINAQGWLSNVDYTPRSRRTKPCIAIVGNSYIQGHHVEIEENVCAVLREVLNETHAVYNLGTSGANFAQFLLTTKYASKALAPEIIVYFVTQGDLAASLLNYSAPGSSNLKFVRENTVFQEVPPPRHQQGRLKRMILRSSLARYLLHNAKLQVALLGHQRAAGSPPPLDDLDSIADHLIQQMSCAAPESRLLFVVDADRKSIYRDPTTTRIRSSAAVQKACSQYDVMFVDMTHSFSTAHSETGKKFDFKHDYHLNAYGHEQLARTIADILRRQQ